MEAIMAHLVDKKLIERANTMLLMGILCACSARCPTTSPTGSAPGDTHPGAAKASSHRRAGLARPRPRFRMKFLEAA